MSFIGEAAPSMGTGNPFSSPLIFNIENTRDLFISAPSFHLISKDFHFFYFCQTPFNRSVIAECD